MTYLKTLIISALLVVASAQVRSYNLDGCINLSPITDRNGRVVKNVCRLSQQLSYDGAVTACSAKGMDLFYAEDSFVFTSFQNYVKSLADINATCGLSWVNACGLWINGKIENSAYWGIMNGVRRVLDQGHYPLAIWTDQRIQGICKVVKRLSGGVGTNQWDCTKVFNPICEYNNTYTQTNCTALNQGKRYYNLNSCQSVGTVRDGCGTVVKGVCSIFSEPLTYDQAVQKCRDQGMDLFTAETKEVYYSFIQYVSAYFKNIHAVCGSVWGVDCGAWIGGRHNGIAWEAIKDFTNVTMNTAHYPIVNGQNPGVYGNHCMVLKNSNGFVHMPNNCTQTFGAICEFDSKV